MLPPRLRDAGYKLVAKYRYKLFGQAASCRAPTPRFQSRFLEYDAEAAEGPGSPFVAARPNIV